MIKIMIIAAIITGIILIFFVSLTVHVRNNEIDATFDFGLIFGIIVTVLFFIEGVLIYCINNDSHPSAMDVYQDKTTLEYKVVDGVKVDSVVIFKNDVTELNIY